MKCRKITQTFSQIKMLFLRKCFPQLDGWFTDTSRHFDVIQKECEQFVFC